MGECFIEEKRHMAGAIEVYAGDLKNNSSGNTDALQKTSNISSANHSTVSANAERKSTNVGNATTDGGKVVMDRPGLRSPNQNGGLYIGGRKPGGSPHGLHRRASSGPSIISSGFHQNFDASEHTLQGTYCNGNLKSGEGSPIATAPKASPSRGIGSTVYGEAAHCGLAVNGGSPVSEVGKGSRALGAGSNGSMCNNVRGIGNIVGSVGVNGSKPSSTRTASTDAQGSAAVSKGGSTSTPRNSGEFSILGNGNLANQSSTTPRHSGEFVVGGNGNSSGSASSSPINSGELSSSGNTNTKTSIMSSPKTYDGANNHGNGSFRVGAGPRVPAEGNISGRLNNCLNHGAAVRGARSTAGSPIKPRPSPTNIANMGNLCKVNLNGASSNGGASTNNAKGKVGNVLGHGPTLANGNVLGHGPPFANGNVLKSGIPSNASASKGMNKGDFPKYSDDALESRDVDLASENSLMMQGRSSRDPEEVKSAGNELYKKGKFVEALSLYERAISMSPGNAAYRSNKAAALSGLGRLAEAVHECEEAIKLEPSYVRAHQRAASLYLRLGLVESAKRHFQAVGQQVDLGELQRVEKVKNHISKCIELRKAANWKSVLRESDAAVVAGADSSPQVFGYKAEALLRLHKPEEADVVLATAQKVESSLTKLGVTPADSFHFVVRALVDMALGRFEEAISAAELAAHVDPRKVEVSYLLRRARAVCRARSLGNEYFKAGKFFEACAAYGEGLENDPGNALLLCNRAACRSKLGQWEKAVEDCNAALDAHPIYTKALLRRANCNAKLERWEDALNDYEALIKEIPGDMDVARGLFEAQVALKKSRGDDNFKMNLGGNVQEVSSNDRFHEAVTFRGLVVVQFIARWDERCKQISPFVDGLCKRYASVKFIKVDVEENPYLAKTESVNFVPTFRIYRNGMKVEEIREPSHQALEYAVQQYSL